jgi:hypothetical protein
MKEMAAEEKISTYAQYKLPSCHVMQIGHDVRMHLTLKSEKKCQADER